jgi:hypothetical protein
MYELDVLGEDGCRDRCAVNCQRMPGRDNHGRPNRQQPFARELRRRDPQRRHNADRAVPIEHGLDRGARLDIEPQQGCGEFLLEGGHSGGERREREYDVDGHAQFRFEPSRQALRPGLEEVDVAGHGACVGEQRAAFFGEYRESGAAVEELYAKLSFQIRQGLADHRLSAPEAAAGRREATFIRRRDEGAELIQ